MGLQNSPSSHLLCKTITASRNLKTIKINLYHKVNDIKEEGGKQKKRQKKNSARIADVFVTFPLPSPTKGITTDQKSHMYPQKQNKPTCGVILVEKHYAPSTHFSSILRCKSSIHVHKYVTGLKSSPRTN